MSVRKRFKNDGSFVWEFCITIQKIPRKQYRKSGFKTKGEAQEAEKDAIIKYKSKQIKLNPNKTTFANVIEIFLEHIKSSNEYSEGTISNYDGYYRNHLEYFVNLKLEELTPYIIQRWLDNATKSKSPYILNGCRKLCKAAFNYAVKMKLITENPFTTMQITKEPIVLRNRLDIEEMRRVIQICKENQPSFFCIFVLAMFTGMRLGEYSALCIEDFDFKKCQVWVTKQYTRRKLKHKTKTITSKRIVDFPPSVGKIIKWHIRKYEIFTGYLFKGKDKDTPISANWINSQFDKLLKSAGYPENYMRVHDLRGQFVDTLHTLGIPTVYISRQVGHARTSTTNDIYSAILSDLNLNAKDAIEEKIFCEHFVSI